VLEQSQVPTRVNICKMLTATVQQPQNYVTFFKFLEIITVGYNTDTDTLHA